LRNTYAKTLTNATAQMTTNPQLPNTNINTHTDIPQPQHKNSHTTPTSGTHNTSSKATATGPAKTTLPSSQTLQHHHHHNYDKLEDMDTDCITHTRKLATPYSSQLIEDLKIIIFPKDKSNTLPTNLKASKTKAKALNKNKHTNNSGSSSN